MSTTPTSELADELARRFQHMATRDGGQLSVVTTDDETVRFRYLPGTAEECAGDACVLAGAELQTMLREAAARRQPGVRVEVEVG